MSAMGWLASGEIAVLLGIVIGGLCLQIRKSA